MEYLIGAIWICVVAVLVVVVLTVRTHIRDLEQWEADEATMFSTPKDQ
jgi:hypothetical protein